MKMKCKLCGPKTKKEILAEIKVLENQMDVLWDKWEKVVLKRERLETKYIDNLKEKESQLDAKLESIRHKKHKLYNKLYEEVRP